MKRRAVLRRAVAGTGPVFGGCVATRNESGTDGESTQSVERTASSTASSPADGESTTAPATETPTATECESVSVGESKDEVYAATAELHGDGWFTSVAASIVRPATDEHPATLEIAVQNRRPVESIYQFGMIPPFSQLWPGHEDADAGLTLHPLQRPEGNSLVDESEDWGAEVVPDEPDDGCWVAADSRAVPDYFETVMLGPCESVRREYLLLGSQETSCPPDGTYVGEEDVQIREDGPLRTFRIRLEITVSR